MGGVRLFLACVVAVAHLRSLGMPPGVGIAVPYELGLNGAFAVMLFYIISGFLMSTVLHEKYDRSRAATVAFYRSRFIRIFSLFWPIAALVLVFVPNTLDAYLGGSVMDMFSGVFLLGADWRVAFAEYPGTHAAAQIHGLEQCWTLAAEWTFYLAAPFLLRSWKAMTVAFAFSLAVRTYLDATVGWSAIWTYAFFPPMLMFFLLGHVSRLIATKWKIALHPAVGIILLGAAMAVFEMHFPVAPESVWFWVGSLCFAGALPGIFALTKNNAFWNALGALSYPVYIVHFILVLQLRQAGIFDLVASLVPAKFAGEAVMLSYLMIIIGAAIAAHWMLEKPVGRAMKRAFEALPERMPQLPRRVVTLPERRPA